MIAFGLYAMVHRSFLNIYDESWPTSAHFLHLYLAPLWVAAGLVFARYALRLSRSIRERHGFLAYWLFGFGFYFYAILVVPCALGIVVDLVATSAYSELVTVRSVNPKDGYRDGVGYRVIVSSARFSEYLIHTDLETGENLAVDRQVTLYWRRLLFFSTLDSIVISADGNNPGERQSGH